MLSKILSKERCLKYPNSLLDHSPSPGICLAEETSEISICISTTADDLPFRSDLIVHNNISDILNATADFLCTISSGHSLNNFSLALQVIEGAHHILEVSE